MTDRVPIIEIKASSALHQGNVALRAGDDALAIRHYALGLLQGSDAPSGPIVGQLARNLLFARRRYRRGRALCGGRRVAVACWSLSENPAGRAYTLAGLYQDLAEQGQAGIQGVEIIGSVFAGRGRDLWAPIRDSRFPIHSILVEDEADFMAQAIDLVSAHPVDLLHVCKPRFPNILFGLLYKLVWEAGVLVDIDDDELAFVGAERSLSLEAWMQTYGGLSPLRDLPGRAWTELAMSFAGAFDGLSVANRALQQRHGGTIIRHARDPRQFQPSAARRARARGRLQIRPDQVVVLFLGTPRRHKGLLETAHALAALKQPELLYLIVGGFPRTEQALKDAILAQQAGGALAVRLLDDQPFAEIPDLLATADLAVFLQDPDSPAARFQTPAKLSDALAMGLTVLAEPTPGLADLAEHGAFIPVSRDTLVSALRDALVQIRDNRDQPPEPHPIFALELSFQANRRHLHALLGAAFHCDNELSATATSSGDALARLAAYPALSPLLCTLVEVRQWRVEC